MRKLKERCDPVCRPAATFAHDDGEADADPEKCCLGLATVASYRLDNFTRAIRTRTHGAFSLTEARTYMPAQECDWKTTSRDGPFIDRLGGLQYPSKHLAYIRFLTTFPSMPQSNVWIDIVALADSDRSKSLCRSNRHGSDRALRPHDHRPRRPGPRPDLRQRHDGLCRRAVGPAMDHHATPAASPSPWPARG